MRKPIKINHIALAVNDMEAALAFWRDALGIELDRIEEVPSENARVAFLPVGATEIELVQPTESDTGLARYLEKNGPGMHHICVEVDDIEAMIAQLRGEGVELINETFRLRDDGIRYAFVHPKSTHGVLVELYELP
jgi:methylmalonyl-CoA/ethylmalonyl-CoA epimerase